MGTGSRYFKYPGLVSGSWLALATPESSKMRGTLSLLVVKEVQEPVGSKSHVSHSRQPKMFYCRVRFARNVMLVRVQRVKPV